MSAPNLPPGPFSLAQAEEFGCSRTRVRALVEAGLVRRLLHGVYVCTATEVTTEVKVAGVALVTHEDAVVCDRTAAWLWDVDAFRLRELDVVPPVESFVLRGHTRTRRAEVWGGVRDLSPGDWVELQGVKVTTPLRTALDLGCALDRREAIAAMDALARRHGFGSTDLARHVPRFRRRRGVVQLRGLVPLVQPEAESTGESWTRLELADSGLPEPVLQHWVDVDGVPTYRLDLAYPHARIAVEYDGRDHHSSPADRAHDERRRAWLRAHGWTVVVVRAEDFGRDADSSWLYAVRDALAVAQQRPHRFYR